MWCSHILPLNTWLQRPLICIFLLSPESCCPGRIVPSDLFTLLIMSSTSVQIQVLCVPALHHLPELCHDDLRTSHFCQKLQCIPTDSVQIPFYFVTSVLGLVEIALHLFDWASCLILLFSSLLKLLQQIPDHSSFLFVLCFSSVTAASTILYSSVSLFTLSSQLLFHVFVSSFTVVPTASISAEIFPLATRLRNFPRIV